MRIKKSKGFTLVEILIIIGIIVVLTSLAFPVYIRARLIANDALVKSLLREMSSGAEFYATAHYGFYPGSEADLTTSKPKFLNRGYCQNTVTGFEFSCSFTNKTYEFIASPQRLGFSGSTTYTITTGGVLTPVH